MKKIIVIGGSNSKNSINKALASYTANQLKGTEVEVIDLSAHEIPLYGIDYEQEHGIPADVVAINDKLTVADGLVVSLAEHNGSYSAAFKSVYDWLSRIHKEVWKNKPMFLMATSPGGRGGMTVLETATKGFPFLGGNIVTTYSLPFFGKNFTENGIADEEKAKELAEKVTVFQAAL
jgi:NAD(P)H-dependent FMN reductase